MTFYSAQDFEQYFVTNVTRFEQIRDESLVEVCQTRVPICDVSSEPIDGTGRLRWNYAGAIAHLS